MFVTLIWVFFLVKAAEIFGHELSKQEIYDNIIHNINRAMPGVHMNKTQTIASHIHNATDHNRVHKVHIPNDPALRDVSSPEFRRRAEGTYEKIFSHCISKSWMTQDKNMSDYRFPDDAQLHFETIRNATAPYRSAPVHEYSNYEGPWIENIFIEKFMDRPLFTFNGLIPIFIQWIDNQILRGRYFDYIHAELDGLLRSDVLYLAVSQGDVGLGKIGRGHPNILVMAAGGFGHIPIPLVKSEIPATPLPETYAQDIGFFGSVGPMQALRIDSLAIVEKEAKAAGLTYKQGSGSGWQQDMESTKYNLAPRGYGRSSFRLAESIQMSRVPVIMHTDVPWVPYVGSNISVETYGFSVGLTPKHNTLVPMVHQLKSVTEEDYFRLVERLRQVRFYYTYPGVVSQIEQFLIDPFGEAGISADSHLRCVPHPREERCCDPDE